MQTAASKRTDSVGGSQSGKNGFRMYMANVNATIACKKKQKQKQKQNKPIEINNEINATVSQKSAKFDHNQLHGSFSQ